jgi:hypothetical protein
MRRLFMLIVIALAAMAQPAAALVIDHDDGTYTYVPDGFVVFLVIVAVVVFVIFYIILSENSGPPPREKTADEYNAEAVLLAAKRHHTEMQTELRKAEIEAARVDAIHKERDEIVAHDKKVRNLNARLDEKRRAS